MDAAQYLQLHIILSAILAAILGLVIGSFLNVVIYRYPKMLKQMWKAECQEFLNQPPSRKPPRFNLIKPRSRCTKCKKTLKSWHNIPLFSYLYLRGKCAYCKTRISPMYPVVETLTAALSVITILRFGVSWVGLAALFFTWSLVALSFIDFKEKILPDTITITMLWLGLFANSFDLFTTPVNAILGALVGYTILWSIAKLFKFIRKIDGMGHGDFKMLAMLGAWLGIGMLLNTLLTAVLIALIISMILLAFKKISKKYPIPFGPYLAFGGFVTLIYGPMLSNLITRMVA